MFGANDITFCADECFNTDCFRHRSNAPINEPRSMAHLLGTGMCELEKCSTCRYMNGICEHPFLGKEAVSRGRWDCIGWMKKEASGESR